MSAIEIDGHRIELSNLDKVFYEEAGVTKGDVIEYYSRIYPTMAPHLADRPLTLHRYPDGIGGEGFYQKEAPDYIPGYVDTVEIEKVEGGKQPQLVCNNEETLVYLANLGTVTFHVWLSRSDRLHYPDKLIFDLDPPGDDFEPVREAAFDLRQLMKELGLYPYVMTTGSDGLHVALPLKRELEFDHVRRVAEVISSYLASRYPDKYTTEVRKAKRRGRLFLDMARNAYGQTSVAPYSLRERKECSVATPIEWEELHDSELQSRSYTIENIFRRLGQKDDPWKSFYDDAVSLADYEEKIEALS
jgi:bifunctional non-homologous end joining protein LigD